MMKRVLVLVSVVVCMCLLFAGCGKSLQSQQEAQETGYIGILSAMENEISLLLEQAEIDHVDTFGDINYYVGTLCG